MKAVQITYYAHLRECAGVDREIFHTAATTLAELYEELTGKYQFLLPVQHLRAAVNDRFVALESSLADNDQVAFIPPVAGG